MDGMITSELCRPLAQTDFISVMEEISLLHC
jgi:hypothetical protein